MTRVAAIDCGTNSIRLLVADVDPETNTLTDVERRMEIVRLGEDVDRTGRFSSGALERTFAACRRYADAIDKAGGVQRLRFVATSASRDVANRDEFTAGVRAVLGTDPEVVSGKEEAALSFAGATRELVGSEFAQPFLVVDIGGGSTELVLGDVTSGDPGSSAPAASVSVDVGCVRMTERHLHSDPPAPAEVAAARTDIEAVLRDAARVVPIEGTGTLVGLAGSVTTDAAMALALPAYLPERIHHARIAATDVHDVAARLLTMTRQQRAALAFMHPGRVDVIGAGALILSCVLDLVPVDEVVVSEHDILDGIAWSLV
jgi:exopolyphosphatase/guanosine-5'-triphosphate,3'-diphosphate pyrophosphatase